MEQMDKKIPLRQNKFSLKAKYMRMYLLDKMMTYLMMSAA